MMGAKRCTKPGCKKIAVSKGLCKLHREGAEDNMRKCEFCEKKTRAPLMTFVAIRWWAFRIGLGPIKCACHDHKEDLMKLMLDDARLVMSEEEAVRSVLKAFGIKVPDDESLESAASTLKNKMLK